MRRAIALVIAIVSSVSCSAAWAQGNRDGIIKVLGRAAIEVTPDYATIRVGVSTRASTPTSALDQNSAAARKVIDFAKKFGVSDGDIATDAINLGPAFKSVREPNGFTRQEPDGYSASNTVRVKLGEIGRVGTFMRQVLDQGATNIGGVHFGATNYETYADQARTQAVEDATRQARRLAEAANVKLGAVQEIVYPPRQSYSVNGAADMPVRRGAMTVPVEAGTIEISAQVDVTWRIE
jgi:uncharacterized protein YggE